MNIANLINCRKVHSNQYNIFKGMFNNIRFLCVLFGIIIVQNIFVYFGGRVFRTKPLTLKQQLMCIGIACVGPIISLIAKLFMKDHDYIDENKLQNKKNKNERNGKKERTIKI